MKKVCAIVAGLLFCFLLFGCQSAPKEIPPYFPHSDTLRLDATEEEVLAAEDVEPEIGLGGTIVEGYYNRVEPALVDGIAFDLSFSKHRVDEMMGLYLTTQNDKDFSTEYQQLDRYFTKIYGKGERISDEDSWWGEGYFQLLDQKEWFFTLDNGKEYHLMLYHDSALEEYKGHLEYFLGFSISQKRP